AARGRLAPRGSHEEPHRARDPRLGRRLGHAPRGARRAGAHRGARGLRRRRAHARALERGALALARDRGRRRVTEPGVLRPGVRAAVWLVIGLSIAGTVAAIVWGQKVARPVPG